MPADAAASKQSVSSLFWNLAILLPPVTVVVVASRILFANQGIPLQGDLAFPLTLQRYDDLFSSMWNIHGNFSNLEQIDRLMFMRPILFVLNAANASSLTLAKVLLLGLLITSGLSAYALARRIVVGCMESAPPWAPPVIAALAGVVYEFGPPVMYMTSAYFYLLAYALAPLLILLMFRAASGTRFWWQSAIAGGLLLTTASASPQHTVFLASGLLLLSLVLTLRYGARATAPGVALFYTTFVASSLYWIVPMAPLALKGSISPGYLPDWNDTIVFSRNASFYNVLTGYSEWLVWWTPASFWPPALLVLLQAARIVWPACALLVAAYAWRLWVVRWAIVAATVLLLGAMGAASPIAPMYRFAMFKVPVLNSVGWIIRAPEKFDGYLWLVFVVLGVVGASLVLARVRSKMAIALVIAVPLVAFASSLPKNLAGFGDKYVPVQVPNEYYQIAEALREEPGGTIWLAPYYNATSGPAANVAYTWSPDKQAPVFLPNSMPGNTFGAYHYTNPFAQAYAYLYAHPENLSRKLAVLGIYNIVLADDLVGGHGGFVRLQGYIQGDESITLVARFGENLYLYRVRGAPQEMSSLTETANQVIVVQGGRASQEDVYGASRLNLSNVHLIYAEQQTDPTWLTSSKYFGQYPWLLDDRSYVDVVMDHFATEYGTAFVSQTDTSDLYGGWGRTLTAQATYENYPWHSYLTGLLQIPDPWDFDYGRGVVWSASNGVAISQRRTANPGTYELLVRALTSKYSSTIGISIGNQRKFAPLNSETSSSLRWFDLGAVTLSNAASAISIENGDQHSVVNMVALVPIDQFRAESDRVRAVMDTISLTLVMHEPVRPVIQYVPVGSYTVIGGSARLVSLATLSVINPVGSKLLVAKGDLYAVERTNSGDTPVELGGLKWMSPVFQAKGLAPGPEGSKAQVAGGEPQFQYIRSQSVELPKDCNNVTLAGTADLDGVVDFSTSIQFRTRSGYLISTAETVKGVNGSLVAMNIGGTADVPKGAKLLSIQLGDRNPIHAASAQPNVYLTCWKRPIHATDAIALVSQDVSTTTRGNILLLHSAFDPMWVLVGHDRIAGIPVDGAETAFLGGTGSDRVLYAPDESLAIGWRLSALATLTVVLLSLLSAGLYPARRSVPKRRLRRRALRGWLSPGLRALVVGRPQR